jgi:hypothetical protein
LTFKAGSADGRRAFGPLRFAARILVTAVLAESDFVVQMLLADNGLSSNCG